jgi:hypothetical protein
MIANVNEQLWIDFDLDTAVFLDTIAYWLKKNAANKQTRNFKDGRYWTYNTQEAFTKMFPGWKRESIRRIIRNCVKNGLLIVGNFNKKGYDRTGWYSLTDKAVEYYPSLWLIIQEKADNPGGVSCGDSNQACGDSNQPIPKQLPSSSNINITISDNDILDAYHEVLPECPKLKRVDSKLSAQLKRMRKDWPSYQKDGKPFSIESFIDYLRYIKTNYSWFIKPYTTEAGNVRRNNLRVLTREINITKIVNGEFNAN